MKKTIEEFYKEIQESEELQLQLKGFIENKDKEGLIAWTKEQGCETTGDEVKAFLTEKQNELVESGELTPDDLEQVSGGTGATVVGTVLAFSVVSIAAEAIFVCVTSSSSRCI